MAVFSNEEAETIDKVLNFSSRPVTCIPPSSKFMITHLVQARIAQLVAYRLGTRVVPGPGSNPGKEDNFSVKIRNWIVRI